MGRKVRVAAFTDLCEKKPRTVADNLDWTCGILDLVAVEKPDIVCLTEVFDTRDTGLAHLDMAQALEGPTFTRIAEKARQHHCYIVCAFIEKRAGLVFNTAAVIDRNGGLTGRYDKIHPTISEVEDHVVPGKNEPTVIRTDFGKIGCQICFDANWPECWQALKQAGAEIIFFPSAFSAGRLLQSMATMFHVPVVAACCDQCCRIIDRDGLVLNRQGVYQKWVLATLDLDSPLFHLDFQFEKMEAVRKALGPAVTIRVYEEEGWWRVLPERDDISVPDIIKKFELETLEDYLARSTRMQNTARDQAMLRPV
jgi:predicted amidohydrolase